jgi:hypothetical protein
MAAGLRKMARAVQSFLSTRSAVADAEPPQLLHLPDELWIECILRNGKEGADGEAVGASELIRLRRVCRAGWRIARDAKHEDTVAREKERRARAQHDDRERRKLLNHLNPAIVRSALAGDMDAVIAALDSGVAVDSCATWVESEIKASGFEKEWTWSRDTALSMACSQGNLPLARLLVERGADPKHRVCNEENVWYTPAKIARQHGHVFVADYIDTVVAWDDARLAEERARAAHRAAVELRVLARHKRAAGPPWVQPEDLEPSVDQHVAGASGMFGDLLGLWPVGHPERARKEARLEGLRAAERARRERVALEKVATTFETMASHLVSGRGAEETHPATTAPPAHEATRDELVEAAQFLVLCLEILTGPGGSPQDFGQFGQFEQALRALRALCEGPGGAEMPRGKLAEFEAVQAAETARVRQAEVARRAAEVERAQQRARQATAFEQHRAREVLRCRAIGRRPMGHCMDTRCGATREERDFCTWGHSDHDLPAHCMHLPNCRNGDRCWYNHLMRPSQLCPVVSPPAASASCGGARDDGARAGGAEAANEDDLTSEEEDDDVMVVLRQPDHDQPYPYPRPYPYPHPY